jgi:ribosomal protein L11 methyltransferase
MLAIDATDLHPSTRLALSALSWLEERVSPRSILEIGCGNGILSLTAAHMWNARVLACDISEHAIVDARDNIKQYQYDNIDVLRSDGFKHPKIGHNAHYDLIIGNLLAQWQVAMAKDIKKSLNQGGVVILSGIFAWQMEGIEAALSAINMNIIHKLIENEWQCAVVCHTIST